MNTQPPPMHVPIPVRDQTKTDNDHLRLLAVFHFVTAGLTLVGLLFLGAHFAIMNSVMGNPEMWKNQQQGGPPPEEFFAVFKWFYLVMGLIILAGGLLNLLSGLYLRKKRNRMFSIIVAGLNCLQMPVGTVLGVFTFIVLMRDSVQQAYEMESDHSK